MTLEAEKIAEELARRSGDDQDALSDAGDAGTGSGMTTPAPTVNSIVPVGSDASLGGMYALTANVCSKNLENVPGNLTVVVGRKSGKPVSCLLH